MASEGFRVLLRLTAVAAAALNLAASEDASHCDLAIVGAGVGGAFAAWQSAEAGKKVCVFELSDRPGGRIHSLRGQGPRGDLVVEAGAYRFAPHEVCETMAANESWCIYTPVTAAAVKRLGLRAAVYDPEPKNWDYNMRKLVDARGHNVGYLTLVETMLGRAAANGTEVHFRTGVQALRADNGSGVELDLGAGRSVRAGAVLLNIPQGPLLKLLRSSGAPFSTTFPAPLYVPSSFPIMKLYIHYEDAWWRNDLGLTAGAFKNNVGGSSHVIHMHDVPAQSPAPLLGQYHDGDVRCDGPGGRCRGYLQAFYSGGPALDFYKNFHPFEGESAVHLSPESSEHRALLAAVHEALVALHREALDAVNATERVVRAGPDSGVLSIWSQGVTGIHAGCHVPKPGKHPAPEDLPTAALRPFPGWQVYVANEAYGPVPCFAEGSLNMSSAVLEDLGIPKPAWLATEIHGSVKHPPPLMDPFLLQGVESRAPPHPEYAVVV